MVSEQRLPFSPEQKLRNTESEKSKSPIERLFETFLAHKTLNRIIQRDLEHLSEMLLGRGVGGPYLSMLVAMVCWSIVDCQTINGKLPSSLCTFTCPDWFLLVLRDCLFVG